MSEIDYLALLRQTISNENAQTGDCINCINEFTQFIQLGDEAKKEFSAPEKTAPPEFPSGTVVVFGTGGLDPNKPSPNPYMNERQYTQVHAVTWSDGEIELFQQRQATFEVLLLTEVEAEAVAELLVWRDQSGDDRKACLECAHYRHRKGRQWGLCGCRDGGSFTGGETEFFRLRRCNGFLGCLND